jgi:hypothetical protein|uniref:Uncharacterized protein n=1 Tax=Zea mays TaxID=4577 RepID=A0A804M525_MAIZE
MKYKKSRDATGLGSNSDGGWQKGGGDVPPSIQLDIMEHRGAAATTGLGTGGTADSASFFESWRERTPGSSGSGRGSSGGGDGREPPEKRLALFALRRAVFEKAASDFC